MERTLELFYDELVIGADLSALLYCYIKKVPHIFTRYIRPHKYNLDRDYEKDVQSYDYSFYNLALNGLSPLCDKVQTIRLEDENSLSVATNDNFLAKINFNKLVISDDFKLEGLPQKIGKTNVDNYVIDLYGMDERKVLPDIIDRDERIIKKVFYHKSVIRKLRQRSITVISVMSDEELKQIEFSENYIRLRLLRLFYPKIQAFFHRTRDTYSLGKNLYELPDNMRVLSEDIETIKNMEPVEHEYMSFLEDVIWNKFSKKKE